jgi:hypothetical protein
MTMPADVRLPPPDMAMPPPSGPRACPSANFCWENPLPQPRLLYATWGTGPSDIWAVGHYGVALHWNGTSWTQFPTGTTSTLYAVWGRASNQVWVAGQNGLLLYWDGTRFTPQTSGTTNELRAIWGTSTAVWAAGDGGTLLKWDGTSWSTAATGIAYGLYAIWGSAANDIWAVGASGYACHYGGTSWTCGREFGTGQTAYAITGTSKSNVWVFGSMAEAWLWNGTTWTPKSRPSTSSEIYSVHALSASNIWAVGNSGVALSYDGTLWSSGAVGAGHLFGVWGADASNVYAVGVAGEIDRYDGTTWKRVNSGFTAQVTAMWGTSDRDVWVFTADRSARHFDGSKWTTTMLPSPGYSATGTGPSDMWVGGDSGRVYRYDGTKWTTETTRDGSQINGIYIAAADRVALAGSSSVQLWDGARYTVSLGTTGSSVWGTGPNDIWVGGASGCYIYRFNGSTWSSAMSIPGCGSSPIVDIHGTSPNDIYFAAEYSSNLYRWDGTKFISITVGSPYGKVSVFATPTRVFVGTTDGEVLTGIGSTWSQAVDVDARIHKIAGFAADKAWVGGSSGFVLSYKP